LWEEHQEKTETGGNPRNALSLETLQKHLEKAQEELKDVKKQFAEKSPYSGAKLQTVCRVIPAELAKRPRALDELSQWKNRRKSSEGMGRCCGTGRRIFHDPMQLNEDKADELSGFSSTN
jgi:hypothetical protein